MFTFIVSSIMILISQYAMAFSGQPKTLETTYEIKSKVDGMRYTREYTYQIVLPNFRLDQFSCGHI